MSLQENIAKFRKARDMTQEDLAEQVDVTQGMIAHFERGLRVPTVAILANIADVLDVSMDSLVGRKDGREHAKSEKN